MDVTNPFFHLACTVALLGMLSGALPAAAQQPSSTSETTNTASTRLPDSPGAVRSYSTEKNDSILLLAQSQNEPSSAPPPQTAAPQKPVGTAASEAPNVSAIAASQPAGVAIAPAKQRRVRTIVLRTGAILAAGAAIGVVVALTAATPPKPPGAH